MNEIGEKVPSHLSWAELERRINNVGRLRKVLPWYIGDLMIAAEPHGEKAWQLFNNFGYSGGALANFKYIAKRFPPEDRTSELGFSTYQAIAPFQKREREKLIVRVLSGELTRADIRTLAAQRLESSASEAAMPQNGSKGPKNPLPSGLETLLDATGIALLGAGKLIARRMRGEAVDALLADACDELMAYLIDLRARCTPAAAE